MSSPKFLAVRDAHTQEVVHVVTLGERDPGDVFDGTAAHLNWDHYYLTFEEVDPNGRENHD